MLTHEVLTVLRYTVHSCTTSKPHQVETLTLYPHKWLFQCFFIQ